MANFYSALATLQSNANPKALTAPIDITPATRTIPCTYTMLGTEAAADVVNLIKLPAGSIVLPDQSYVRNNAIAGTATVQIGDSGSATRYSTALDVAAAGLDAFTGGANVAIAPYVTTAEGYVVMTFATLATPAAGKIITVYLTVNQPN